MTLKSLGPFLALVFGLGWGLAGSAILFKDQVEALFGPISGTNPLFILAVYSPGIAGVLLVWRHYGLTGFGRFFRRLTLWGSLLIPMLCHFQINGPAWPEAHPWRNYLFAVVAVIIVVINRRTMQSRGTGVTEVLAPVEERDPSPASESSR